MVVTIGHQTCQLALSSALYRHVSAFVRWDRFRRAHDVNTWRYRRLWAGIRSHHSVSSWATHLLVSSVSVLWSPRETCRPTFLTRRASSSSLYFSVSWCTVRMECFRVSYPHLQYIK